MIKLNTFFEPETLLQKLVKWTVTILIVLIGLGSFLFQLDDAVAQERACKYPVYVDAVVSVKPECAKITCDQVYSRYLTYEYQGQTYRDIFYYQSKGWDQNEQEANISVIIDPNNPNQLMQDMVNWRYDVSLVVLSAGIALLIYGIAIEQHRFRQWRYSKAAKKMRLAVCPDYLKDVFLIFIAILILTFLVLALIFPYRLLKNLFL